MPLERKNRNIILRETRFGRGIFNYYSPATGFNWGTAAALGAIGLLLGYSVYQTVTGDLGYLADAFT